MPDASRFPTVRDVIEALRHCEVYDDHHSPCEECPYDGVCSTRSFAVTRDAIKFLELLEQYSMRENPVLCVHNNGDSIWRTSCGLCKKSLYSEDFKYCPWCGQKIKKWEE